MCGVFGVVNNQNLSRKRIQDISDLLLLFSESRGKEAAGIAVKNGGAIRMIKEPNMASKLIKNKKYRNIFNEISSDFNLIGHTRLVTNGSLEANKNNQPVVKCGIVGVHNGIIINDKELWKLTSLKRDLEVDTESLLALMRERLSLGDSIQEATKFIYKNIKGTASVCLLFEDRKSLLLATNCGSLYYILNPNRSTLIFASEKFILNSLLKKRFIKRMGFESPIQLYANSGIVINTDNLELSNFIFNESAPQVVESLKDSCKLIDLSSYPSVAEKLKPSSNFNFICKDFSKIKQIRRCSKCILPETMPFISFDGLGVCNYCTNYICSEYVGKPQLEELVQRSRSRDKSADCLVAFSGGRDSSFGLHYLVKELGMRPIAFSYDWGMITDLGRRNQARLCGALGVEHIILSADIKRKRDYIKKNVLAWLKKPNLGMIPIFMAGDKQYFYYANKLIKQAEIKMSFMCQNPLERTDFKSGFCGTEPTFGGGPRVYELSLKNKFRLASYYGKQYLTNPSFINKSIFDTVGAYLSYYIINHNYYNLFKYIPWVEKDIDSTLINVYDWELAKDTKSTWRIADGTTAFYNYIYYLVAGFTENDTFRSNQIREGILTREEALKIVEQENQPRIESLNWYCQTIGIDLDTTIKIINSIPKLYDK